MQMTQIFYSLYHPIKCHINNTITHSLFCIFILFPIGLSFYLSFTDYDYISPPRWVGLANYTKALTGDPLFWHTLKVTFKFAALAIPLEFMFSFGVALLLNFRGYGMKVYRTIYYLPSVLPAVAVSIVWMWIFRPMTYLT